jgi:hypothetical protein
LYVKRLTSEDLPAFANKIVVCAMEREREREREREEKKEVVGLVCHERMTY